MRHDVKHSRRFRRAVQFVLKWETVYDSRGRAVATNDPADPGGVTKYGIDQRSHPRVNIAKLTKQQAIDIYYSEYWVPVCADKMPIPIGEVMFDIAVNNGRARAARWLQTILNVAADGIIGPVTIAAANKASPVEIARDLIARRDRFYRAIATGSKRKFLRGWLNRNNDLLVFAMSLCRPS